MLSRLIGLLLLVAGIFTSGGLFYLVATSGSFSAPTGSLIANYDPNLLQNSQTAIQRHLGLVSFWDDYIVEHVLLRTGWQIATLCAIFFVLPGWLMLFHRSDS